MEKVSGVAEPC
ncbi:hypothetical protein MZH02_23740 [Escherichia coli]|nr:hypothetical protein [Escherichia coli]MCK3209510.1 hypothetical protein [Escherichia coli]